MSTMVTRRFFIGGAVSFGALAGCGLLRRPHSFKVGETPRLRFGVVSDVHVRLAMDRVSLFEGYDTTTFERALVWFRDQGVDAVMLCGDRGRASLRLRGVLRRKEEIRRRRRFQFRADESTGPQSDDVRLREGRVVNGVSVG